MLAEATTTELTKVENPQGLRENQIVAKQGGTIAGNARKDIKKRTGRPVITPQNARQLNETVVEMIEEVAATVDTGKEEL